MEIKRCIVDKFILSSNKSQHECVLKDMSTIANVCFQKTDNLLLQTPAVPRNCSYSCLRSVLVYIRHTGACSERSLNARLKLYPLKQQYSLICQPQNNKGCCYSKGYNCSAPRRKVWRIESMPFGVNYKHTDTCLLRFLFGTVEL